jgi:hypothetical protein
MALTDQPYLPLYVDDWMNNNKLKLCSPAAHGVMIAIMCLMHKEPTYGKILLKQKFKQTDKQISNFALQVAKQTAFDLLDVEPALQELLDEQVLIIEDDFLICKRMVKDAEISAKRASSGGKGGKNTQKKNKEFASTFAKANDEANNQANTGIGIDNKELSGLSTVSEEFVESILKQVEAMEDFVFDPAHRQLYLMIVLRMMDVFLQKNPGYFVHKESDYSACLRIAYNIAQMKGWNKDSVLNTNLEACVSSWQKIVDFVHEDKWLGERSLTDIASVKEWQRLVQKMSKPKKNETHFATPKQPSLGKSEGAGKALSLLQQQIATVAAGAASA